MTWPELLDYLAQKYRYESPLTDSYEIMADLMRKNGPKQIYQDVRSRLKDVKLQEPRIRLAALPWFSAFTTNYDLALETALSECQELSVTSIFRGNEYDLAGLQSELLCVKLMGSVDVPYGQPGSMVLDRGDYEQARAERSRLLDRLADHAAKLSFLFVGYSFNDEVFTSVVSRLAKTVGTPKNTVYYAVFKEAPNEEEKYMLNQYGVQPIVANLDEFIVELSREVSRINPKDHTLKRIPCGSDVIVVDSKRISSFLRQHNPILFEDMEAEVSPYDFFRGKSDGLKPFSLGWHFERPEMSRLVELIAKQKSPDDCQVYCVRGPLGSGRTSAIRSVVNTLIREHRSLAVRVLGYSFTPIPNEDEIRRFTEEVARAADEQKIERPKRIVFWAESQLDASLLLRFKRMALKYEYPTALLFEDVLDQRQSKENRGDLDGLSDICVDVPLSEDEKGKLVDYLLGVVRKHKFEAIDQDRLVDIIDREKEFLPILYSVVDPSHRCIDAIVDAGLKNIKNPDAVTCLQICSITTSMGMPVPISLLKRALSAERGRIFTYPEIFEIAEKDGREFLVISEDIRTNYYLSVHHPCISNHVAEALGQKKIDNLLVIVAGAADIRSREDAEFIKELLIYRGVNSEVATPFSRNGLEQALIEIRKRQPARPILHHLARLYAQNDINDPRIVPLLKEALAEPPESYALSERPENPQTTLAKVLWDQGKGSLQARERTDPEVVEIISLLDRAKETTMPNVAAYDVHVRVLRDLWRNKDDESKVSLVTETIQVVNEGLEVCADDPLAVDSLTNQLVTSIAEIDYHKAEKTAEDMLTNKSDGTGYYVLARIELHQKSNAVKASAFLDKSMSGEHFPSDAIALKIEILLKDMSPSQPFLLELAEKLIASPIRRLGWKTYYNLGVILAVNGKQTMAEKWLSDARQRAPFYRERPIDLFVKEKGGSRRTFRGKVKFMSLNEGRVYGHNFNEWDGDIFFRPADQRYRIDLHAGLYVEFEIGFSLRGPVCFDVRPQGLPPEPPSGSRKQESIVR